MRCFVYTVYASLSVAAFFALWITSPTRSHLLIVSSQTHPESTTQRPVTDCLFIDCIIASITTSDEEEEKTTTTHQRPPSPMASSTTSPSPSNNILQSLPQEILEHTARFLFPMHIPSLCNLRLACKDLSTRLTSLIPKLCFEELYVLMMDCQSMRRRMLEICRHSQFGKFVKVVEFNITVLEDEEHQSGVFLEGEEWEDWITTEEQREVYEEHVQFRGYVQECVEFMLKIFQVSGRKKMPEIKTMFGGLCPEDKSIQRPWGVKRLEEELGGRRLTFGHASTDQEAHEMVCRAIFSSSSPSDTKTENLTLGHVNYAFKPSILAPMIQEVDGVEPFKHLTRLSLHLSEQKKTDVWGDEFFTASEIDAERRGLMWLISQATCLEFLELYCKAPYMMEKDRSGDTVFFQALAKTSLPSFPKPLQKIKNLKFFGHEIPKDMLLEFVREHASTLKSLELWEIIDKKRDDRDVKMEILEAGKEILDFKLKMGRVYEGTRKAVYSNHEGWVLPQWESLDPLGRVRKV